MRSYFLIFVLLFAACSSDDDSNNTNNTNNNTNEGLCVGVVCQPGISCRDQVVVEATGTCDEATGTCVEEDGITCADDEMCSTGMGCVQNPCADLSCDQPADACNGNVATLYTGGGTCNPSDGMCNYSMVTMTMNCAANNEVCIDGACVVPDPVAPMMGEIVITEIMNNPSAIAEVNGEWFEVLNTTTKPLLLNGIEIGDLGGTAITVTDGNDIVVAPQAYFVFGSNADPNANGNIVVGYEFDRVLFSLDNDTDAIVLTIAGTVLDRVEYDMATWGDSNGASMQYGAQYNPAQNNNADVQYWCISETAMGNGDFGTPGAENANCQ